MNRVLGDGSFCVDATNDLLHGYACKKVIMTWLYSLLTEQNNIVIRSEDGMDAGHPLLESSSIWADVSVDVV